MGFKEFCFKDSWHFRDLAQVSFLAGCCPPSIVVRTEALALGVERLGKCSRAASGK